MVDTNEDQSHLAWAMCLATRVHEPNAGVAIVCCMCPSWDVAAIQRCGYSPSAGARRLEHPVAPGAPCGASWEVSLPPARIPQMRCESPAPAVVHHCVGLETQGLLTRIPGIHETAGVRLQRHAALSGSRLIRSSPQAEPATAMSRVEAVSSWQASRKTCPGTDREGDVYRTRDFRGPREGDGLRHRSWHGGSATPALTQPPV